LGGRALILGTVALERLWTLARIWLCRKTPDKGTLGYCVHNLLLAAADIFPPTVSGQFDPAHTVKVPLPA
jgi:hypothetical protein